MAKSLLTGALIAAVLASPAMAEKMKVVTTFTVLSDMAQNVAGGCGRGCLHHQAGS